MNTPREPGLQSSMESDTYELLSREEQDRHIAEHLATNDYVDEAGDVYRPDVLPPDDDPDD